MRIAHDWGRASGRPRTSAKVSRKSSYARALLCSAAAALAACDNSPKSAANPTDPVNAMGSRENEAVGTEVRGVAYPLVTVKPSASVDMSVGQQSTFSALLSEPNGNSWTSCCSTWTSSDASIASVSATGYGVEDGERGIVVAHKAGTATITVTTQSGTSGTLNVTVGSESSGSGSAGASSGGTGGSSGGSGSGGTPTASPSPPPPSGSYHQPSGFVQQVNMPSITSTAAFSNFSPTSTSSTGQWSGNLTTVPGGSGLRITYRPNLMAGGSPVRFGISLASAGSGWYYQRMKIRFSSNWTNANNPVVKLCEPQTEQEGNPAGPDENHVISAFVHADPTQSYLTVLLQGPDSHFRDLTEQPVANPAANLSDGNWHTMEVLFGPESSPGAGNGTYTGWVDGTQVASYTNVQWLAAGNRAGWPYLLFDPVYGGMDSSPPYIMYWDFDALYVSTR